MPKRLLCCVALAVLVACVPPPVDDDTVPNFDPEETRAGMIQERESTVHAREYAV